MIFSNPKVVSVFRSIWVGLAFAVIAHSFFVFLSFLVLFLAFSPDATNLHAVIGFLSAVIFAVAFAGYAMRSKIKLLNNSRISVLVATLPTLLLVVLYTYLNGDNNVPPILTIPVIYTIGTIIAFSYFRRQIGSR